MGLKVFLVKGASYYATHKVTLTHAPTQGFDQFNK